MQEAPEVSRPRQTFRSIEAVYAAMPEQAADIRRALLSTRAAEALAIELWDAGFPVSPSTIRTYRRVMRATEESTTDD